MHPSTETTQSVSPLAPLGIEAALRAKEDPSFAPRPKIFDEFALTDRVGLVSGGNRGIGLEMAIAFAEAGARVVYCFDLPQEPSDVFKSAREYVSRTCCGRRQEEIGDKEQRFDFCVAAAGILKSETDCLEYSAEEFREVLDVNTTGALFTAQAAGRQMTRFGRGGSILMIASQCGSVANKDHAWVAYNTSKSAVLQMARSMACELGPKKIRVNTLSPGCIYTQMTAAYLNKYPHLLDKWSSLAPLGRMGRCDEMRGVAIWLVSDASSFCTGSDILVDGGYTAW
ncbi:hypothetical protein JVU11DRAFT_496 [Chiua virens]|nr:hypothetical protein JVU11DRAFT_496 [Chiua virens]